MRICWLYAKLSATLHPRQQKPKTGRAFKNAQLDLPIRHALETGLDHLQPPKPLKSHNSTTTGFVNNNMHQRRSKSWYMRCD